MKKAKNIVIPEKDCWRLQILASAVIKLGVVHEEEEEEDLDITGYISLLLNGKSMGKDHINGR